MLCAMAVIILGLFRERKCLVIDSSAVMKTHFVKAVAAGDHLYAF